MAIDWTMLLRELQNAEQRGDDLHARMLRERLIEHRLDLREARLAGRLGPGDFMLLIQLARQLERAGLSPDAMAVYAGAHAHARTQRDDYTAVFFLLRMVVCATAALDRSQAEALLATALAFGTSLPGAAETIEAAALLSPPRSGSFDQTSLRVNALYAVGRFFAAWGELGVAADALDRCLALSEGHDDPFLNRAEVALLAAEIAVDRGALSSVDELRIRFASAADDSLQVRWDLVAAYAHRLRGELSQSEQTAERAWLRSRGRDDDAAAAALRLRADVLGILNRLDDAEEVLRRLGAEDDDVHVLRELIAARRSVEETSAATPRSSVGYRRREQVSEDRADEAPQFAKRRGERVRDDWTRALQHLNLALHRSQMRTAAAELAILIRWSEAIDSPLAAAERENAWARTALASGDAVSALRHADDAAARFRNLGMPMHEREALHVAIAALDDPRAGDGRGTAIEERFARSAELISGIEARLAPIDRRMFRLNKWNALDLEMERWCSEIPDLAAASPRQLRRLLARIDARRQSATSGDETKRWSLTLPWVASLPRCVAIVYFVALPHRLQVFVLVGRSCRMLSVPVPRAALWEVVIATIRALRDAAAPGPPPSCAAAALRLGLDQIVAALPEQVNELQLVPDDVLINMPFAALTVDGRTLPERGFAITVVPVPRWIAAAERPLSIVRRGAAFGITRTAIAGLEPLESAEVEAKVVAEVLRPGVETVLGDAATASAIMQALPTLQTSHFACHGDFDDQHPERSGLAVADRWLTVADLRGLDLSRLRLAVLGSCWSATTKVLPGREMVGLPIELLDRGCRTVVASLWRIGDETALEFARQYYVAVRRMTPARAMAELQKRATRERAPADWAWFAIYAAGISPRWPARLWLAVCRAASALALSIRRKSVSGTTGG